MDISCTNVSLYEIVAYWVKGYIPKKRVKIVFHEYFYDPQENKIIIQFFTKDETD